MSTVLARTSRLPQMGRFAWLMALYGENHARLERLFEAAALAPGRYISSVGDGLDVQMDVIEQHAYTTELRLTYVLVDPVTGEPDPSAFLRVYQDTRQLEATHCYVGRRWQDVLGMHPPARALIGHRLRMNTFLGKWLEYLVDRGHGMATLRRVDSAANERIIAAPA